MGKRNKAKDRVGESKTMNCGKVLTNEELTVKSLEKIVTGKEELDMSFYDGTLDRLKARVIVEKSSRPIFFTYGYAWENPTTNHIAIDKADALKKIANEGHLDIDFKTNEIHLNAFSGNDVWFW